MIKNINANPEVRRLFDHVHRNISPIASITPLYLPRGLSGSEFLTYSADKLYIASSLVFGTATTAAAVVSANRVDFHNQADAIYFNYKEGNAFYNSGTADIMYWVPSAKMLPVLFSRLSYLGFTAIHFNGWRLILS